MAASPAAARLGRPLWALMMAVAIALGYALLAPEPGEAPAVVKPESYWVWASIDPAQVPATGDIYLYQGHYRKDGGPLQYHTEGLRPQSGLFAGRDVILVYRLSELVDLEDLIGRYKYQKNLWHEQGVTVTGLQVDFDCPKAKLAAYAAWLEPLKLHLSNRTKVSVTGLADWLVSAPAGTVETLARHVDEIAFKLYGDAANSSALQALAATDYDFKLGLTALQSKDEAITPAKRASGYQGDILVTGQP